MKGFRRKLLHWMAVAAIGAGSALAGENKSEAPASAESAWSASLATGWDSLYMFRGVNQLPGFLGYGSSISWTALSLSFSPTAADSFSLASWSAFGLGDSDYQEVDGVFAYTRTIGDFSLTGGYSLYAVLTAPQALFAHELSVAAAYEIHLGGASVTPSLEYAYTVGPAPGQGGYVKAGSSYLDLRVDGDIPLPGGQFRAAPWVATGFNFGYNTVETPDGVEPFNGANHFEVGLSMPVLLGRGLTVSPYVALSHKWVALAGTAPNVVWGGVALTFEF